MFLKALCGQCSNKVMLCSPAVGLLWSPRCLSFSSVHSPSSYLFLISPQRISFISPESQCVWRRAGFEDIKYGSRCRETHSGGWRRKWWNLPLTVPGQRHYILALQHAEGYTFLLVWKNLVKLKRFLIRWSIARLDCRAIYSGTKESQTGRGMHLFREEEAGLPRTLKRNWLLAVESSRIHLASPASAVCKGFGDPPKLR